MSPHTLKELSLVSCVGMKLPFAGPARELYISPWFKAARRLVEGRGEWRILSAKYGLVGADQIIEPYDVTLNDMPIEQRRKWATLVRCQMSDLFGDRVTIYAGERYREFLIDFLSTRFGSVDIPMADLKIGQQLQWMKRELEQPVSINWSPAKVPEGYRTF